MHCRFTSHMIIIFSSIIIILIGHHILIHHNGCDYDYLHKPFYHSSQPSLFWYHQAYTNLEHVSEVQSYANHHNCWNISGKPKIMSRPMTWGSGWMCRASKAFRDLNWTLRDLMLLESTRETSNLWLYILAWSPKREQEICNYYWNATRHSIKGFLWY